MDRNSLCLYGPKIIFRSYDFVPIYKIVKKKWYTSTFSYKDHIDNL